ncbi:MAG: enoyl-CoA hydratase/carnithine racemase [bacterium]|jgi:enoyl-CoA hydratase/carnithine racemase
MSTLELKKEGSVYTLTMNNGENSFTKDVVDEHLAILDELEATKENASLVVTGSNPKFWSTGINLEWLLKEAGERPEYFDEFKGILDQLFVRYALLDMPTIACLNGHAFAGGAILATSFDFITMRSDRGWFCFPEIDIKIPFTHAMHLVLELVSNKHLLKEMLLTGKRVGGKEALEKNLADAIFTEEELLPKTQELAALLAQKDRATYKAIKHGIRHHLVGVL